MKTARRRQRQFDPLATPAGVRGLLGKLRAAAPTLIPAEEERVISLLNAARYAELKGNSGTQRGRPSPWTRAELLAVSAQLRALLERETGNRISLQTFVGQHLQLLAYPEEIAAALQTGQLNKQEALALARLTAEKLQTTEAEAQRVRVELLRSHLAANGSQNQLRARVKEMLGESAVVSRETLALGVFKTDSLLELNRDDVRHVFFETMKDLFYAIRKFDPEDLLPEDVAEFMTAADSLSNTLRALELRVQQRRQQQRVATLPTPEPVEIVTDPLTGRISYKFGASS